MINIGGARPGEISMSTFGHPGRHTDCIGSPLRFAKEPPAPEALVPKFPSPEEIHIVVAGGFAGRFSVAIPGWLGTKNGSRPVTRALENGLT